MVEGQKDQAATWDKKSPAAIWAAYGKLYGVLPGLYDIAGAISIGDLVNLTWLKPRAS